MRFMNTKFPFAVRETESVAGIKMVVPLPGADSTESCRRPSRPFAHAEQSQSLFFRLAKARAPPERICRCL
jgi:hypothetical protein